VATDLIARAQAGDEDAFRQLVDPYRHELQVHCYRILGSIHDAEDALQETLLSAWRSLRAFEGRSSIRAWLYRIATSRCLNALRAGSRRPSTEGGGPMFKFPNPTRLGEVLWLEPYPDTLLDRIADTASGPEAQYETREAVSLAFVTALQLLPPRQRAVLVLRDVLGFHAEEVAEVLESTEESVTSALKRARRTLQLRLAEDRDREAPPPPNSDAERELVEQFTRAFEAQDVDGIVALLTEDVSLTMPPLPFEYVGPEGARLFLAAAVAYQGPRPRLIATRANGQPAFGLYIRDPRAGIFHALGVLVITLAGGRIAAITRFDNSVLRYFGLPRTVPG
jgi:RNA polymerase sigma-70 factor (ECF subfamily)